MRLNKLEMSVKKGNKHEVRAVKWLESGSEKCKRQERGGELKIKGELR